MPESVLAGTSPDGAENQGSGQPNVAPLQGDAYTSMGGPGSVENAVSASLALSTMFDSHLFSDHPERTRKASVALGSHCPRRLFTNLLETRRQDNRYGDGFGPIPADPSSECLAPALAALYCRVSGWGVGGALPTRAGRFPLPPARLVPPT